MDSGEQQTHRFVEQILKKQNPTYVLHYWNRLANVRQYYTSFGMRMQRLVNVGAQVEEHERAYEGYGNHKGAGAHVPQTTILRSAERQLVCAQTIREPNQKD